MFCAHAKEVISSLPQEYSKNVKMATELKKSVLCAGVLLKRNL